MVSKQFKVKVFRKVKDQHGNIIKVDPETFPEELILALAQNDPLIEPDAQLQAHQNRAANLVDYKTPHICKMSPVLTNTYMTRREASPLEEVRHKFVEQPFKLRNDTYENFGKPKKLG